MGFFKGRESEKVRKEKIIIDQYWFLLYKKFFKKKLDKAFSAQFFYRYLLLLLISPPPLSHKWSLEGWKKLKNFHGNQGDRGGRDSGHPFLDFCFFVFWCALDGSMFLFDHWCLDYVNQNRSGKNLILPFGPRISISTVFYRPFLLLKNRLQSAVTDTGKRPICLHNGILSEPRKSNLL